MTQKTYRYFILWLPLIFVVLYTYFQSNHKQLSNIILTSANDTNIRGANIHGTNSLTYNVGGNLNIASVQDTHKSKNTSIGISAEI